MAVDWARAVSVSLSVEAKKEAPPYLQLGACCCVAQAMAHWACGSAELALVAQL